MNIIGMMLDGLESHWKSRSSFATPLINVFTAKPISLNDVKTQQQINSALKTAELGLIAMCILTAALAGATAFSFLASPTVVGGTFKLIFAISSGVLCYDLWKCRRITSRLGDVFLGIIKHQVQNTNPDTTESAAWSKKFARVRKDMNSLIVIGRFVDFLYPFFAPQPNSGASSSRRTGP